MAVPVLREAVPDEFEAVVQGVFGTGPPSG
jgi:hypothetical protein